MKTIRKNKLFVTCCLAASQWLGMFTVSVLAYVFPYLLLLGIIFLLYSSVAVTAFVSLCLGLLRWRKVSRYWILPTFLCLMALITPFFSAGFGRALNQWFFFRHLIEYEKVVSDLTHNKAAVGNELKIVKIDRLPWNVQSVRYARYQNGASVVEFLNCSDIPLLHSGYVYTNRGGPNDLRGSNLDLENQWPYVRHIFGSWYHFSDSSIL